MSRVAAFLLLSVLIGCDKSDPAPAVVEDDPKGPAEPKLSAEEENQAKLTSWLDYAREQETKKQLEAIDELVKFEQEYGIEVVPSLVGLLDDPGTHGLGEYYPGEPRSTREAAVIALLKLGEKGEAVIDSQVVPKLIEDLDERDNAVREHTVYALGLLGERAMPARPKLAELTGDEIGEVRAAAYQVLEGLGTDLATAELITSRLQHPNMQVRRSAALSLKWLDLTSSMVDNLLLGVQDDEITIRMAAIDAVGRLGPNASSAVPALIGLLRGVAKEFDPDDDHGPRDLAALGALIRIGEPAVNDLMVFLADEEPTVRYLGAIALAGIGPDARAALPKLQEMMEKETDYADVSLAAAQAIVHIGGDPKPAVDYATGLLDHREPGVRFLAVRTVGTLGEHAEPAVPKLVQALKDKEPEIRRAAMNALGNLGPAAAPAVPALAVQLSSDDPVTSRAAAEILSRVGPPAVKAVPELGRAAADPEQDQEVRRMVARTLAELGPKAAPAAEDLATAMNDQKADQFLREEFAEALGRIGTASDAVVPALTKALAETKKQDFALKTAAIRGLGVIGPEAKSAVPELIVAMNEGYSNQRVAAIEALGRVGPEAKAAAPEMRKRVEGRAGDLQRSWAAAALMIITPDASAEMAPVLSEELRRATRAERESDQLSVLRAIGMAGAAAAPLLPEVRDATSAESPEVRRQAIEALASVGGASEETVRDLIAVLSDPEEVVRRAAVKTLAALGPAAKPAVERLRGLTRTDPELRAEAKRALEAIETN